MKGRPSWPNQRHNEFFADYASNDMSQAALARRAGVRYATIDQWVRQAQVSRARAALRLRPVTPRFA